MKTLLFLLLTLTSLSAYAQRRHKVEFIQNGNLTIAEGDTLRLGLGSGQNGSFNHISLKFKAVLGDFTGIGAVWGNKLVIIDSIVEFNDGLNLIFVINVTTNTPVRFSITDFELAILKKEVVAVNGRPLF